MKEKIEDELNLREIVIVHVPREEKERTSIDMKQLKVSGILPELEIGKQSTTQLRYSSKRKS